MRKFAEGDPVLLDGQYEATVIRVIPGRSPAEYQVFVNAMAKPIVVGSRLVPVRKSGTQEANQWDRPLQSLRDFRFEIARQRLIGRLSDTLLSYGSARIDIQAHQFKPLLRLMDSPYRRLLIADEVGLGKTIEAGIVLSEFELRESVNRVLVVCPNALLFKWHDELEAKFGFTFQRWGSRDLRAWLEQEFAGRGGGPVRAITSHTSIGDAEVVELLERSQPPLDFLIVDEAHHLRNRGTELFKAGERLANNSDLVLFLSATPLHLGNRDLFNLLHLLLPEVFRDESTFEAQLAPNRWLNEANRLLQAGVPNADVRGVLLNVFTTQLSDAFSRSLQFGEMLDRLARSAPLERIERVRFQRACIDLNSLGSILTRTRKAEVMAFTTREPVSVRLPFTQAEKAFYEAVTSLFSERLTKGGARFGAQMYQRQLCSCIPAIRAMLSGALLATRMGKTVGRQVPDEADQESSGVAAFPSVALKRALALGQKVGSHDSKFAELLRILDRHLGPSGGGRVVVFSFFRRTLDYLEIQLRNRYRVVQLRGGIPLDEREAIIGRFRRGDAQILLSSEVGGEGLDFQFCNVLVNYDLPWNPMQVEQRIGRLDRFGQKSEKIFIYNLLVEDTVEARIFGRLFDRLDIFRAAVGDMDAILGNSVSTFSEIALDADLTPEQQAAKAEKLADQLLHRKAEWDRIASDRHSLVGADQYLLDRFTAARRGRAHVTGVELRTFVEVGLERFFPESRIADVLGGIHLQPDLKFTNYVRQNVYGLGGGGHQRGDFVLRPLLRLWSAADAKSSVPITFDPAAGFADRNLELLGPRHPYVRALVSRMEELPQTEIGMSLLRVPMSDSLASGRYLLSVYLVELNGQVSERRLECTVVDVGDDTVRRMAMSELLLLIDRGEDAADTLLIPDDDLMLRALNASDDAVNKAASRDAEVLRSREEDFRQLKYGAMRIRLERRLEVAKRVAATVGSSRIRDLRLQEARNVRILLDQLERGLRSTAHQTASARRLAIALLHVS